eukprot:scaffold9094_cov80-Skeletonema_menzelii.AAC.1
MSTQGRRGTSMMGSFSGGSIGYAYPYEEDLPINLGDSETNRTTRSDAVTTASSRHNNHKAIYELAQQSSSRQVGSTLYSSGSNVGRRRPPNRALRFQNNNINTPNTNSQQSSMMSSAQQQFQSSAASFQSSLNSSFGGVGQSSFMSSAPSSSRQSTVPMSMSGNPLHRVYIEENDHPGELELDKEELKKMIITEEGDDLYNDMYSHHHSSANNGASSVALSAEEHSSVITPLATPSTFDASLSYTSNNPLVKQMIKMSHSEYFRRSIFLAMLFTLMAIGTFLTIENIIQVKDVNAWIEPSSNSNTNNGINWSMGNDAPKPIMGISKISPAIQDNIADWAVGTSYIRGIVDNYGSLTLTDTTKFRDVPLFWGSEYADFKGNGGGSSVMEGVLSCLNLVQVSSEGVMENKKDLSSNVEGDGGGGAGGDYLQLTVVMSMGRKYINVDTTTKDGIERANVLALGSSGMADVIYSSLLQDVSSLFTTLNQGRMFVLIRHPIEREMARFRYLRRGQYERTKLNDWQRGNLQDMSYVEYARSEFARDNWMTRELVNKRCIDGKGEDGMACAPLDDRDVHTAKEILRRKALIGLYSDIMGAVQHHGRYFGWDGKGRSFEDATMFCFQNHILEGMRKDALGGKDLDPNDAMEHSDAYVALMEKNRFDLELFTYAQTLYKYQIELS